MAFSLNSGISLSGSSSHFKSIPNFGVSPSLDYLKPKMVPPSGSSSVWGQSLVVQDHKCSSLLKLDSSTKLSIAQAHASSCVSKGLRWWEMTLKPNMIEINSAKELVDTLKNAADRLVIVGFYSPGCGGCRALHPKVCQLAEANPGAIFLQINFENLKPMCHALHVHVLPFFRFYRGAEGRLCSFSCTISTIKKFKDALAKYGTERRHGLGPARGLGESELMNLAMIGEISIEVSHAVASSVGDQERQIEELAMMKGFEMSNPLSLSFVAADQVDPKEEAAAVLVA